MEKTKSEVKSMLAEVFQLSPADLADDLTFGDLPQWDSMGHMDVMLMLEERFGVEMTPENIGGLISLDAICMYLESNGHV